MVELCNNFYLGTQKECEEKLKSDCRGWAFVHACKSPSHMDLVGYRGNLNKDHEYYMLKEDGNRLALNLVDGKFSLDWEAHHREMINYTLEYINRKIAEGFNVLIHCNMGISRSPSIAMLYMASIGCFNYIGFDETEIEFQKIYPEYSPNTNIYENIKRMWDSVVTNNRS